MPEPDRPQIYLVTPPELDPETFPDRLARLLDAHEIACVRLALATRDATRISRTADALRETCHAADVALVIAEHAGLAQRLGLDGVHLADGPRSVRKTRTALGPDAIVGAFCGISRHDGMTAGEAGADYVAFGPAGATALGDGGQAPHELFAWWSAMIELPVVAEGALDADTIAELAPSADFFAIGEEIWSAEDPSAALAALIAAMA